MRSFHTTSAVLLRRPWQTFKNGQLWYGNMKTGSKRHALTTKQGNKHYYKGTGSSGYGQLNKNGKYVVNWTKVRTYVVPLDLAQTNLKPLVSPFVPQVRQTFVGYDDGFKSADLTWQKIVDFIEYGENYDAVDAALNGYLEEYVNPDSIKQQPAETEAEK